MKLFLIIVIIAFAVYFIHADEEKVIKYLTKGVHLISAAITKIKAGIVKVITLVKKIFKRK